MDAQTKPFIWMFLGILATSRALGDYPLKVIFFFLKVQNVHILNKRVFKIGFQPLYNPSLPQKN